MKYKDKTPEAKQKQLAATRAWALRNKDHIRAYQREWKKRTYSSEWHRQRRYGVSAAVFDAMLLAQGNKCAICETTESGARGWHLDHDHSNGAPRGILCVRCNGGLGLFKDTPEMLERAARYLRQAKVQHISQETT